MEEKPFEIFPRGSKKTYGLMELVKGKGPMIDKEPEDTIFTWPHLFYVEFLTILITVAILFFLSMYIQAPLEEIASTATTPNPMKAPWYFLGLQEILVYFDPWIAGVVLPVFILIGLMVIPFIDVNPKGKGYYTFSERKFAVSTYAFGMALWLTLIIIGVWFRGLDWNWYWPWENWEVHKPILGGLVDLSVIISRILGVSEFVGIAISDLIVFGYFVVGLIIPVFIFRRFYKQLGFLRYIITMTLFLIMTGIPIKIALRLMFSIKYVMITPWFKI
jgi:hypothetical protein